MPTDLLCCRQRISSALGLRLSLATVCVCLQGSLCLCPCNSEKMASVGKTPRLCVDTGGSAAAQGGGAGGSSEQQHGISEQPFTPSFSAASVQEEPVLEPVLEPVAKVSEIAAQYLQARKRRLHVDHVARARHAPVADPRLANNLHALADLSRPRQQWLRHVPITDLPEPAALDAGSVRVGSGPVHSRVHQQLKEDLQADRVDFDLVLHENEESRRSMAAFRGYLGSLPEEHQVVWNMYHGIRSHPGENAGFTTELERSSSLRGRAGCRSSTTPSPRDSGSREAWHRYRGHRRAVRE